MLDRMILTISNVGRSLAFYEAILKPLNIRFFLPHKGEGDHPDLWGFGDGKRAFFWIKQGSLIQRPFTGGSWPKTMVRSMNFTGRQYPLVRCAVHISGAGRGFVETFMRELGRTSVSIRGLR